MSKTILITGATKGIGRACAEAFSAAGWSVTAVARTEADLLDMHGQCAEHIIVADLGEPADLAKIPTKAYDALLLNAATYRPGNLLDPEDQFEALLPLNLLGNHRLARRLLPPMVARGAGHLLVIGSTGTDNWKPHMTAYVATKYALRGLFLGWQAELARTPVQSTLVAPGATLTSSWENETPPDDILQPEEVARVVLDAVLTGKSGRITIDRKHDK